MTYDGYSLYHINLKMLNWLVLNLPAYNKGEKV